METGVGLIMYEREKQLMRLDEDHDNEWTHGELVKAAIFAALNGRGHTAAYKQYEFAEFEKNVKRDSHDPIANLVKAGSLIAAEIDRIQSLEPEEK
jgi:hypothetical protein